MINWNEVVIILRRNYRKDYIIAKMAGCHQKTISDLATRKQLEPRFSLGVKLLDIAHDTNDKSFLSRVMV